MTAQHKWCTKLRQKQQLLPKINRGIERESLRVDGKGQLSSQPHPKALGSTLTHPLITTDFAEAMLEFVTPVYQSVEALMQQLNDIHHITVQNMGDELLWPASMPCYISEKNNIKIAQYGRSNQGKLKMLYREGLKNRYGALMQVISGVHYNFSLPEAFWQEQPNTPVTQQQISAGYLKMIRNYYRFGWVIPYLFGSSPILCRSFLSGKESALPFEELKPNKGIYLPYATSLRMSNLGYTSTAQEPLVVRFNHLDEYIADLRRATVTPYPAFEEIGVKINGVWRQINSHILQLENEYYAPIRPKRVVKADERPSDAMSARGIQYIEVRALDVNPYSPVGITADQVRFLDLFLLWCASVDSPMIDESTMKQLKQNWQKVILEGRRPNLMLWQQADQQQHKLQDLGRQLCHELYQIAEIYDDSMTGSVYRDLCSATLAQFDDPELTLSAQMLQDIRQGKGIGDYLLDKALHYKQQWLQQPISSEMNQYFKQLAQQSLQEQQQIELNDSQPFDEYLMAQTHSRH